MGKDISYEIWTNSFHIDESNNISQNSAWFLLKPGKTDIKSNKYKLNPGDILKIGRITLRIRDIYFSNKKDTSSLLNESNCTNINIKEMNTLKTEGEQLNNNTILRVVHYGLHLLLQGFRHALQALLQLCLQLLVVFQRSLFAQAFHVGLEHYWCVSRNGLGDVVAVAARCCKHYDGQERHHRCDYFLHNR